MASSGYASRFDSVLYPAANERLLDTVLAMPSAATRSRAGVRAGGGLEVTMLTGPDRARVAPGGGIINDTGAGAGSYKFVIPANVDLALATRPGVSTSRIDIVAVRILNVDERVGDGSGNRYVEAYLITGTAGASPSAPAVPAEQLAIAQLTVPSSGTVLVSNPPPRISALGGVTPVTNQAERDAISPIYDGLVVYREDTDVFEGRAAGAWKNLSGARSFTRKGSNELVTSSTTLQNDDVLSFPVLAGYTYTFRAVLYCDAAAAGANGDIKVAFSFPTGTLDFTLIGPNNADLTTGSDSPGEWIARLAATSGVTSIPVGLSQSAGTPVGVVLQGTFVATNAGTVQLMWAQQTSSATASRVLAGSHILADLVA